ncbi:SEC-C metal-binding domain-containing protein [Actinomyces mediterranea]
MQNARRDSSAPCPCGSTARFADCCLPMFEGEPRRRWMNVDGRIHRA